MLSRKTFGLLFSMKSGILSSKAAGGQERSGYEARKNKLKESTH